MPRARPDTPAADRMAVLADPMRRAICRYIDDAFEGPRLVPAEPAAAAQVEQWVSIVNTHVDPIWLRQYAGAYMFPGTPDGSPNRPVIDAALAKMEQQFAVMDRGRRRASRGRPVHARRHEFPADPVLHGQVSRERGAA